MVLSLLVECLTHTGSDHPQSRLCLTGEAHLVFYDTWENEHSTHLKLIEREAYHFMSRTAGSETWSISKLH